MAAAGQTDSSLSYRELKIKVSKVSFTRKAMASSSFCFQQFRVTHTSASYRPETLWHSPPRSCVCLWSFRERKKLTLTTNTTCRSNKKEMEFTVGCNRARTHWGIVRYGNWKARGINYHDLWSTLFSIHWGIEHSAGASFWHLPGSTLKNLLRLF